VSHYSGLFVAKNDNRAEAPPGTVHKAARGRSERNGTAGAKQFVTHALFVVAECPFLIKGRPHTAATPRSRSESRGSLSQAGTSAIGQHTETKHWRSRTDRQPSVARSLHSAFLRHSAPFQHSNWGVIFRQLPKGENVPNSQLEQVAVVPSASSLFETAIFFRSPIEATGPVRHGAIAACR
jgi:hypothetical protein